MILKLLLFIATSLIVTNESLHARLTSKPSIPNELQELLDSLYITGYMPEYVLPEEELTETEKTEGEYLDFPELKNTQDDVFVPPESEYIKNNLHYKNIKGHKRLIPDKDWRPKEDHNWEKMWGPNISPEDLRLDLIAHVSENLTDKEQVQNISNKLDFLIPIPEKGTYQPMNKAMELNIQPLHNISTEQPFWYNLPSRLSTSMGNVYQPPHQQLFRFGNPESNMTISPVRFPTNQNGNGHQLGPASKEEQVQPQPSSILQPPLNKVSDPQNTIKDPLQASVPQQPHSAEKEQVQPTGTVHLPKPQPAQQSAMVLQESMMQSSLLNTNEQAKSDEIFEKGNIYQSSRGSNLNDDDTRIESKVVSQIGSIQDVSKLDTDRIDTAIENRIESNGAKTENLETKVVSPTNNVSDNNQGIQKVQVIENTPMKNTGDQQKKNPKKMFTFFNIFKKNKKDQEQQNTSIECKTIERSPSSLAELYNQLTNHEMEENIQLDNREMEENVMEREEEDLMKRETHEEMPYQKTKNEMFGDN